MSSPLLRGWVGGTKCGKAAIVEGSLAGFLISSMGMVTLSQLASQASVVKTLYLINEQESTVWKTTKLDVKSPLHLAGGRTCYPP